MNRALWVPTIWLLYTSSKPLALWLHQTVDNPESGSPLDRAFLIMLIFIALWILLHRRFDWHSAMKMNAWLLALIVFMLVSVFWSTILMTSFSRWIRELQAVLMAFVLLSERSPRKAIESVIRKSTYILIPFSLLLIKYFPLYGVQYGRWSGVQTWIGVTQQKNGLGRLCLISALFLIWSIGRRGQGHTVSVWKYETHAEIFVLIITLWLLRGPGGSTFSATGVYALVVGLLVYLSLRFLNKFRINLPFGILATIIIVIIVFGTVALFVGGSNVRFVASPAGRNTTLTGRTDVWASLLPLVKQRPLLGRGFGGFWTPRTREVFNISEAHSGYLEVLLGLGFVGLTLVSIFLLSSCRKAVKELSRDLDWGILWICYLIMAVVHNITESSIDTLTSQLTAIIMFFSVSSVYNSFRKQQS